MTALSDTDKIDFIYKSVNEPIGPYRNPKEHLFDDAVSIDHENYHLTKPFVISAFTGTAAGLLSGILAIQNQKPSGQYVLQNAQKPLDVATLNTEVHTPINDQMHNTHNDTVMLGGISAAFLAAAVTIAIKSKNLSKKIDNIYKECQPSPQELSPSHT